MPLTIGKKIALLVILPLLALVLLSAAGLRGVDRVNQHLREVNEDLVPSLQLIAIMQRDFGVMHAVLYRHILTADPAKKPDVEKRILDMRKGIDEALAKYEKTYASRDSEKTEAANARNALVAYTEMANRVMKLSQDGDVAGAQAIMDKEATPKRSAVHNSMSKLFEINTAEGKERAEIADKDYRAVIIQTLVIGGIMVALVALAGFLIGRSIITPIHRMRESMVSTADTLDFTQRLKLANNDEIGTAVRAYEGLLERLQNNLREIKQRIDNIHQASAVMASSSDAISASSREQSDSASGMAASIEEMTVSVNHIADRANDARECAAASGVAASEGARVIYATVDKMTGIAGAVQTAATEMQNLKGLSDSISSVVTVIKEVADQTNLLALNAAIEAARAGEQGRGFAVVADEVRKLAERTAKSTQEIGSLLGRIQAATAGASTRMEAAVVEVNVGVQTAQSAGGAIARIQQGTDQIVAMINEISDAVREQSAASNHIALQVERIAQKAEENSAGARDTANSAHQLDGMAQVIRDTVGHYRV